MILRRLRVEGWRCLANPVELGPLDDRISVVYGPNGSGKSTLLWGMIRGLMDNHASRGTAIEALRSWGRKLAPRVAIELEHDGQRLRVAKQFLDAPSSELCRHEGGRWVRLAEGRAADEHVRAMLDGSLPGRGLTSQQHWGLAQVLWAPQGRLELPELAGGVAGAIRASLGAQTTSPATDAIERKIGEAYLAVFTDTGRLRSGKGAPEVVRLQEELEKAEDRRETLQAHVDSFDQLSRTIEQLHARREEIRRMEGPLAKTLETAATEADSYNRLKTERAQQSKEVEAAEARWREWKTRIDSINAAKQDEREFSDELNALEAVLPQRTEAVKRCTDEEAEAVVTLSEVVSRRDGVAQVCHAADEAARHRAARTRLDERERLLCQATELEAAVEGLLERRGRLVAPDTRQLRAIQGAAARCEAARAALAAAMITVRVEAEQDLELYIERADPPGHRRLENGGSVEIAGPGAVEFRIGGVARFRATGPTGSIELLREERDEAQREFESLVDGFPTQDLSRLAELHDEASAVDQEIATVRARLQGALGECTLEQLQSEHSEVAGAVKRIEVEFPDWTETPPEGDALETAARRAQQAFDTDREAADRRHRQCQEAKRAAETELAQTQDRIESTSEQLKQTRKRLAGLLGLKDAGQPAEDFEDELDSRAVELRAAGKSLRETETKLKAFADDPNQKVGEIEQELAAVHAESQQNREEQIRLKERLDVLQAEAPYSALGEAEEEIARLQEEIAAEQLRNDAVRLLYETFRDCRNRAVEAVFEPVQSRATELLRRITGAPLGTVCFSESFLPEHLLPEGLDEPRALEHASGGEQEQIHLAVRLALADVLFAHQRQLMVLDDVLTATDPDRLARILELLDEAAGRYQILILTCHPGPYRELAAARFFDLEAIREETLKPQMNTDGHR